MIEFNDYKKKFGDTVVLDIPKLKLEKNIYWLKGVNGSGKSTLLNSLAGLNNFDGEIFIENCDIKKQKMQHRKIINYVPAEVLFPDFLTGTDLINFYVEAKDGTKDAALEMSEKILLRDALDKKVSAYSSGMKKKLALILAFIGQPEWILLDEPLITLDVASVNIILSTVQQYAQKEIGFIITSHQDAEFDAQHLQLKPLSITNKQLVFE
ncbi:hypothetical protein A9P82_07325 [Arachidicoccus ginsenosidimutans]|uniref:ABC transporter ATP-binding protein n=1 Tax=Arachidicoccus sp. BS20 TaxID=1850526 RepID=UPI0007F0ECBC|nr:ABC transporter ATP-binding protein [Arachidicoccus sp. BS20]ANI89116.1 hypothetical protein A9P82_07325 [Arachidicoccus sp. BS20]